MAVLDERGYEILDPTPVALPVGFKRQVPLAETIRRLVKNELSARAAEAGEETFEEADDFDVDNDFDPKSPWELNFDQEAARAPSGEFQEEAPKEVVGEKTVDSVKTAGPAEKVEDRDGK